MNNPELPYEIRDNGKMVVVEFKLVQLAENLNVTLYEEGAGYYKVDNNQDFLNKQIQILNLVKSLILSFPLIKVNQSHFSINVFIYPEPK